MSQGSVGRISRDRSENKTAWLRSVPPGEAHEIHIAGESVLVARDRRQSLVQGKVELVYDANFRVDRVRVNGTDAVDYGYDRDGLVTSASTLSVARDPGNGIITGSTLGQLSTTQAVTPFAELGDYSASFAGAPVFHEAINARDKLGRITDMQTSTGSSQSTSQSYTYDAAGRLAAVFENSTQITGYAYDANGNRLGRTTATGTVAGRYDNQDRLTRYCPEDPGGAPMPSLGTPCFSYTYRDSGELLTKTDLGNNAQTSYDYDELGELRSVQLPGGHVIQYELDAAGRRVGKRVDGVKQWGLLYLDALRPVAQLGANGGAVSVFVYATRGNVPDYMVRGGVTYRFVTDHVGSVRIVVNVADGSVVQRMEYDESGVVTSDTNPGFQPFGFAGGLYDADTGLVRFGARDYDAVTGRWTARDPLIFGGGDTNLYAYVFNDPVNLIDPTGEIIPLLIGGAIGGAVAGGIAGAIGGAAKALAAGQGWEGALAGAGKGALIGAGTGALTGAVAALAVLPTLYVLAGGAELAVGTQFAAGATFGFYGARLPGPLGALFGTLWPPAKASGDDATAPLCPGSRGR